MYLYRAITSHGDTLDFYLSTRRNTASTKRFLAKTLRPRLLSYSPYHRVTPDTAYPAILLASARHDPRVGAAHIRKFTAALLHTTSSGKPIVLRSEEGVGDGPRAASRTISAEADALAFCATHTGLDPWSAPYFCRRVQKVAEDTTPIPVEPIEAQSHAPMRRELTKFDALPIVTISISSLLLDQFARQGDENDEHTRALTESGEQLPPIVVHGPSMRVINGIHQVRAAIMRGEKTIGARIYHGTYYDDAVLMVVRMSIAHGLP